MRQAPAAPDYRLELMVNRLTDLEHAVASMGGAVLAGLVDAQPVGVDVNREVSLLAEVVGEPTDLVRREVALDDGTEETLLYLSSLTDTQVLNMNVLGALTARRPTGDVADVSEVTTLGDAVKKLLSGHALLFRPGRVCALAAKGYKQRAIEPSKLEDAVRGPHESFNETLATSVALVRRRLPDPGLTFEQHTVGTLTRTDVRLCYIRGLTNDALVNEVRRRLRRVSTDVTFNTNYIDEAIADHPFTVFPTTDFTERPDMVAAALGEGRLAILVDGTPTTLLLPANFWAFLQAPDDYYERWMFATFLRWLRYAFFFIALVAPAMYIALTTFHQQMIPRALLISLARGRQNLPLPAVGETLIMEISLEILREAALHLPSKLGTSISVVGALIIGQAAVSSGLVSWPVVVIVSVTALADFAIPRWPMSLAVRILRFSEIFGAAFFGLPGILVVSLIGLTHMVGLRSFGVPYLAPLAPFSSEAMADVAFRSPHWAPAKRAPYLSPYRSLRRGRGHMPRPPRGPGR